MPSSSAGKEVGDIVQTPDAPIKSWRYLGGGKWEPNDVVRFTATSPGGGVALSAGDEVLQYVAVVQQGIGAELPARPAADIVHWYSHDYIATDLLHPYDQVFPSGPLRLFERGAPGAVHDFSNAHAVVTAPELNGPIDKILDASPRLNDGTAAGSARPLKTGRVNLLPTTETLSAWEKLTGGAGSVPVITPAAGLAPNGTMTAVRVDFNIQDAGNVANVSRLRIVHTSPQGTRYKSRFAYKAFSAADVGKTFRIVRENVVTGGTVVLTLGADWQVFEDVTERSGTGTALNFILDQRGTFTAASASALFAEIDLRYEGSVAQLPPYQSITADDSYDVAGFPVAAGFNGTDKAVSVSAAGGAATQCFWAGAIELGKIAAVQTLFSDAGTNTGYRVRINASNQLEFSAGNGSAYTSVATTRALKIGERAVCTAWHDGVNLYVQLDDGDIASAAFATATAGTAGYTIGKDNGAATSYFSGKLFCYLYLRDRLLTADERAQVRAYCAGKAKSVAT